MILFIRSCEDELMKLLAILGLWWGLRDILMVFSRHYDCFIFSFINMHMIIADTLAHDFPYTPQTAQYLALDPKRAFV